MTAAARQRIYRQRQRRGRVVLRVETDWCALADALHGAGFLAAAELDDRDALARALSRVVEIWTAENFCNA